MLLLQVNKLELSVYLCNFIYYRATAVTEKRAVLQRFSSFSLNVLSASVVIVFTEKFNTNMLPNRIFRRLGINAKDQSFNQKIIVLP
jgi:hypothetical protein